MSENERTHFRSSESIYLSCAPGNADHDDGEPITVVTLVGKKSGEIMPVMLTLDDTRRLTVALLVSLYTADDGFAEKVLHEMFPHEDGRFHWPRPGTL